VSRPLIGVCAAVEPASFGPWVEQPITFLPIAYARSIQNAGGLAVMLPPDAGLTEAPGELLDRIEALVLGGGADIDAASHRSEPHAETTGTNPERDRFELALAREALDRDMPLLGVCRGMQVMNVAAGGTLEQHLPERLGHERHRPVPGKWAEHEVRLAPGSLAAEVVGTERVSVKSHHHQGIREVGKGFEVTGWASDDDTVEAIESPNGDFILGVLWHPEEDPDDTVIPALVERASRS
jgi:putative glutamine amidotransferase